MTPQERAAALCRALLQDLECRHEFTRRDVDPVTKLKWNQQWQDMILLVIQQTRRAALLEAAELHQEWRNGKHSGTFSDLLRHKLAQEG